MRFLLYCIIIVFSGLTGICAQEDNDPPVSPVFTLLTVAPESGKTLLSWTLSPSPDVAGYILYNYRNGEGFAFDTIWNSGTTSYLNNGSFASFFQESYVVAAIDSSGNVSPLSNVLNTIFTSAELDTCNSRIRVRWTDYPSIPVSVEKYVISLSMNGGPFNVAGEAPSSESSFLIFDFVTGENYCIKVSALLSNGSFSGSNVSCISTGMQRPPDWINADYATVSDGKIVVSFTADPLSEIKTYRLERKSLADSQFSTIASLRAEDGMVKYTDNNADPEVIYQYRIAAVNNCNNPVVYSNRAENLVASLIQDAYSITVSWNPYRFWLGGVANYTIMINTGAGYYEKIVLSPSDTSYSISYKDLMFEITGAELCFRVDANEHINIYGIKGASTSAPACTEVTELITVPNAFTPNGDLINDLFRPVLSFTPLEYRLIITDLMNRRLFESRSYSESWDGTSNGTHQPQGVYLYYLSVKAPSGKVYNRSGTLTILAN